MHYGDVGAEGLGLGPLLGCHIGVMAIVEKRGTGPSEVAHLVSVAEQARQPRGIGIGLGVGEGGTVGDAVAYAGELSAYV